MEAVINHEKWCLMKASKCNKSLMMKYYNVKCVFLIFIDVILTDQKWVFKHLKISISKWNIFQMWTVRIGYFNDYSSKHLKPGQLQFYLMQQ